MALLAVSAALRCFKLSEVVGQLIGDEVWYVQAARVMLGFPLVPHHLSGHPLSGIDPNSEHPELAKLIMAGFMRLLGDHEIAWRIPSVILSLVGIALIYGVVLRVGGSRQQALIAAFILSFDSLSFIHGRIAMLDVYLTTFMLAGAYLYLGGRYALSGVMFAVASLCKLNGVLGLAAMLLYSLVQAWRAREPFDRKRWQPPLEAVVFAGLFFLAGLGALDGYWSEYASPFAHIAHMVSYHVGLNSVNSPGTESAPPGWWLNQGGMSYFTWTTTWNGVTKHTLFQAQMNEYLIFAAPFGLVVAVQRAWAGTSKLAMLALTWVVANHLPIILAWAIAGRISYIYYMVPVIPGLAWALAVLLAEVPLSLQASFAVAMLVAFGANFPFKYL